MDEIYQKQPDSSRDANLPPIGSEKSHMSFSTDQYVSELIEYFPTLW
jgi:hypothetical protein